MGEPAPQLAAGERAGGVGSLVKHRERVHSLPRGCSRPQRKVKWLHADGTLSPVRCGAPNKCAYCAMLSAFENALVIKLDALDGHAWPNMTLTTTTARPHWAMPAEELKRAERALRTYLRRKYGRQIEWVGFVEWTTGKAARDGERRVHVHHLVKGLPTFHACGLCFVCEDRKRRPIDCAPCRLGRFTIEVREKWKLYTGDAWRVEVSALRAPLGAVAYFALHHHKEAQKPPPGWSGKRFRPTWGYLSEPIEQLRREARALISDRRIEKELVSYFDPPDGFDPTILDELILERLDDARQAAREAAPTLVKAADGFFELAPVLGRALP